MITSRRSFFWVAFALAASLGLLIGPVHPVSAGVVYILDPNEVGVIVACADINGVWESSNTCDLLQDLSLGQGYSVQVDAGAALLVARNVTVSVSGSIDVEVSGSIANSGVLSIGSNGLVNSNGSLANVGGGTISNSGNIIAFSGYGSFINDGNFSNGATGSVLFQYTQPSHYSGAYLSNYGTIENKGVFTTYANFTNSGRGEILNSGTFVLGSASPDIGGYSAPVTVNLGDIVNSAGGVFSDAGATFNNTGAVTNDGTFVNEAGIVGNNGSVMNQGTMLNKGELNNVNGTIVNQGTLENAGPCSREICPTFTNTGVLTNSKEGLLENDGNLTNWNPDKHSPMLGNFTNEGRVDNSGMLANLIGGNIENRANVTNSGTLVNSNLITNWGAIYNSGQIDNEAEMDNEASGSVVNAQTFLNLGLVNNLGSITNECGTFSGIGETSGNPVLQGKCVAPATSVPEFAQVLVPLVAVIALALVAVQANAVSGRKVPHQELDGR